MFSKKSNNKIEFISQFKNHYEAYPKPYPASKEAPEWYKKQEKYWANRDRVKDVLPNNGQLNTTIKSCMPIFDAMTAGYYIPLQSDVKISQDSSGQIETAWATTLGEVVSSHSIEQYDSYQDIDLNRYNPNALKWENPWVVRTPPGYSSLFIHPMHYDHLPFRCFSGIVDTDKYPLPVNFPFFIEKGFNGYIECGTPVIQVIPFKRESWKPDFSFDENLYKEWNKVRLHFSNKYKRFVRQEKSWK